MFRTWILRTWLYEIFFAVFLGLLIGYLAKRLLVFSRQRNYIDKENILAYLLALAFTVTGITGLLESDDILASFFCGIIFCWDGRYHSEIKDSHLYEVLDLMINTSFFILFGAGFATRLRYLAPALAVLVLRRLPVIFAFRPAIRQLYNLRETFFAGWYGPVGVGALFFMTHSVDELGCGPAGDGRTGVEYWCAEMVYAVNMMVMCSVVLHGTTAVIIHFSLKKRRNVEEMYNTESEYTEVELFD